MGPKRSFTPSGNAQDYSAFVREHVLNDESISPTDRYCAIKDAVRTALTDSLDRQDVSAVLTIGADFGQDLVSLACDRKSILSELLMVMTHDYSTFTHMSNVCTYCILLAQAYGINDRQQLTEIAQGALLHDLGKWYVPAALLNKPSSLSPEEQAVMRCHPTRGFEELCLQPHLSWGQLMMVYQHHERCDGSGYPIGLLQDEIHPWGRICAVADVYDALTRDRPYRRGSDANEVLGYLDRNSKRSFDKDLIKCWIATLTASPR